LARTFKPWVFAFKNIFCHLSDLFNHVRLSLDMWHPFGHKVNVNHPAKLWVDALGIGLPDFKLRNMVGGQ